MTTDAKPLSPEDEEYARDYLATGKGTEWEHSFVVMLDAVRRELRTAKAKLATEKANAVRRIAWLETEWGTALTVAEQLREELAAEKVRAEHVAGALDTQAAAIADLRDAERRKREEAEAKLDELEMQIHIGERPVRRELRQALADLAAQTKRAEEAEAKVAMLTRDVEAAALSDAHYDGDLGDCKRDLATLREALEEVRAMAIRSLATGTPSVASILVSCGDALASVQQKASGESVDAGMHPGSTARDHAPPRGSGEGGFASPLNLAFQQAWVPREELTAAQVKLAAQTKRAEEAMTECELLNADKASFAQQLQQSNYALVTLRKAALEFIRDSAPHPFYAGNSGENLRALASVQQKTSATESPTRSRLAAEARDTCLPQTPGNEAERLSVEIPTSGNCEPRGDGGERPALTPDWRALLANLVEALPRCSQCRDVATSAKYDEGPFACDDHYLFEEYGHFDYTTPLRAACKALEDKS